MFDRGLCGHQVFLEGCLERRGLRRDKGQLQVVDDPVHHGEIREEGADLHPPSALGFRMEAPKSGRCCLLLSGRGVCLPGFSQRGQGSSPYRKAADFICFCRSGNVRTGIRRFHRQGAATGAGGRLDGIRDGHIQRSSTRLFFRPDRRRRGGV